MAVLIMYWWLGNGYIATSFQEFNTLDTCEAALTKLHNTVDRPETFMRDKIERVNGLCVNK